MSLLKRIARLEGSVRGSAAFVVDSMEDYRRLKDVFNFVDVLEQFSVEEDTDFDRRPLYADLIEDGTIEESERYRESKRVGLQRFIQQIKSR